MTNSIKILQRYNVGDKVLISHCNNELRKCTVDLVQFDQEKNEIRYIVVFEEIRSSTQKSYQGRLEINDSVITDLVSRSVVGDDFIWNYIKEHRCNKCPLPDCSDCPIYDKYYSESLSQGPFYFPRIGDRIEISLAKLSSQPNSICRDVITVDDKKFYGRIDTISSISGYHNPITLDDLRISGYYTTKLGYTDYPSRFIDLKLDRTSLLQRSDIIQFEFKDVSEFLCASCIYSDCDDCKFKIKKNV